MSNFHESLQQGRTGETLIAQWLRRRGSHVLPVYEIAENQFKGPALYAADGDTVIAPDMAIFNHNGIKFIEAKHKNAFSWYRKKGIWTTGIDKHHFHQYINFQAQVNCPVWILFLHRGGQAKDSPPSPSGLFGNDLLILKDCVDHSSDRHGRTGMVYWNKDSLKKIADYPLT